MSANHGTTDPTGLPGGGSNSCNLYYQDPNLSANASEALDLNLIGQQDVQPLTPDEVIVVKVSTASLSDALVYKATWTGPVATTTAGVEGVDAVSGSAQGYPQVIFRPAVLVEGATSYDNSSSALGRFLALDPGAKAQYEFTDDSGDSSLWTLQSYFANMPFVFTNPLLSQIPAESVKSVQVTKISTAPLTANANATLGATNFSAGQSPIMSDYILSTTTGASPATNDYALDLFQQADAAGKVAYWQVATGTNGTSGSTTATPASSAIGLVDPTSNYSQVSFAEGDSITVYVTYNMTKTKTFHLDSPSDLGGPGTAKFTLTAADGSVVNVSDGMSMTSSPASKTVAYQFMASNGPIYQFGFNFPQCFASIDGGGRIGNFNVAWGPVEGAQSYKLFFASRSDVNPASNSGDPNALTHSVSNPTPYFYASTSAITGNSYMVSPQEFFNPRRNHDSVNVFVYAYSDSNASVRITNSLPLTYLFIGVDNGRAAVQIWESMYWPSDQYSHRLKDGIICDNAPLLAKLTY